MRTFPFRPLLLSLLLLLSFGTTASFAQLVKGTGGFTPLRGTGGFPDNNDPTAQRSGFASDSTETTDVPEGIYAWHVDSRFGDIRPTGYDTIPHAFQRTNFTEGMWGEYNTTGNLGAPRIARLFELQGANMQTHPFLFKLPYDYFLQPADSLLFTNTKSPFTTLTYHSCGNKTNGEDRLIGRFAVNVGKRLGMGFNVDYLYGRGYYNAQSTADLNAKFYISYRTDQYTLHAYAAHTYLKTRENGGIESDDYVTRPESYPTSYGTADIPTNLQRAWNRIGGKDIFLTQRYSLGFHRYRDAKGKVIRREDLPKMWGVKQSHADSLKTDSLSKGHSLAAIPSGQLPAATVKPAAAPADSLAPRPATGFIPRGVTNVRTKGEGASAENDSLKITSEFVPVSSFIHTLRINNDTRRFLVNEQTNASAPGYFADYYLPGDSANDFTRHWEVDNTLAFELHEGFNRWMKMGLRLFGRHEFNSYGFTAPYLSQAVSKTHFTENHLTLGAQLLSEQSRYVQYHALGSLRTSGKEWGEFNVEADARFLIPVRRDSIMLTLNGFFRNESPSFYYRRYFARNAWWTHDDFSKMLHTRIKACLSYRQTAVTATLENLQNYLYFQEALTPYAGTDGVTSYRHAIAPAQAGSNIQLLALTLSQGLHFGIFHFDARLTYQATTDKVRYPLPVFTGYANAYLRFRIARVLRTELGADVTYFTRYDAPTYSPIIGSYAVQDATYKTAVGNYPIVNAYLNFHLKRTRFYIQASHVNYSSGSGDPFLVPHYPVNRMVIRFGLSWNFVN